MLELWVLELPCHLSSVSCLVVTSHSCFSKAWWEYNVVVGSDHVSLVSHCLDSKPSIAACCSVILGELLISLSPFPYWLNIPTWWAGR